MTSKTLHTFDFLDLAQYANEGRYWHNASKDFHLFYVGRDDVHDILKHVLSWVTVSLYLNMFGFDDEELNQSYQLKPRRLVNTGLSGLDFSCRIPDYFTI